MGSPRSITIQHKLAGLFFALIAAIVVILTMIFAGGIDRTAEAALEERVGVYGRVLAREAEGAVASADGAMARELVEGIGTDPSIEEATIYGSRGELLASFGTVSAEAHNEALLVREAHAVRCVTMVTARGAKEGALVVRMSSRNTESDQHRTLGLTLLTSFVALIVGLVVSWQIGGSVVQRLRRIQAATQAVTKGKLGLLPLKDETNDEFGALARDFNTMTKRMRDLVESLETSAEEEKVYFDELVAGKTKELRLRNQDLRFVLDNVGQGFVTIDGTGALSKERSAILGQWFGPVPQTMRIWDLIGNVDQRAGQWLQVGWEPLFDGSLPLEMALDQLPAEIRFPEGRVIGIEYRPILEDEAVKRVIVVLSDRTAEVARQRAEAAQSELAAIAGHIVYDPTGIEEFLEEGTAIIGQIRGNEKNESAGSLAEMKRLLHTLKGNAGFFGLERLTKHVHKIESRADETGDVPLPDDLLALDGLWEELEHVVKPLLGSRRGAVEVTLAELEELVASIRAGRQREEIASTMESWKLESMQKRLERMAEQAKVVAAKLGKKDIVVRVDANGVRLDGEKWGPFFGSLIHVIRNAVDHGIETADERRRGGKPVTGTLVLRTLRRDGAVILEIIDDGRGVDWARLKSKATKLGIKFTPENMTELLFADGLSTKSDVTEFSGRGVGLAACREACRERGGDVEVVSRQGLGTTFRFRLPQRDESRRKLRAGNARLTA